MVKWKVVTKTEPDTGDFPVTIVRSRDRDRAVWTKYLDRVLSGEDRESVAEYFEDGEMVTSEDWFARPS